MMENNIIKDLGFKLGTGELFYNFFNWKTENLNSSQIGKMIF